MAASTFVGVHKLSAEKRTTPIRNYKRCLTSPHIPKGRLLLQLNKGEKNLKSHAVEVALREQIF